MIHSRPKWTLAVLAVLAAFAFSIVPARSAERDIYPAPAQAKIDLAAALDASAATHKHAIRDLGGNWCPDCHVLDRSFHDSANPPIREVTYILVRVNIGRMDENLDIA